jgi:hypothetical protein
MTHTRAMDDSEGTFSTWTPAAFFVCPKNPQHHTGEFRTWESKDGAFEDKQYRCCICTHTYWVDGIDS